MKRTLLPLLALLTLVSCNWTSGDDVKSHQAEIAEKLKKKDPIEVLYLLGRPTLEFQDTVAGYAINVLRFEDQLAIKRAFPYRDIANEDKLFVEVAFKDNECFDAKTNLACYIIPPTEFDGSIRSIVIMCATLLILAAIWLISQISANAKNARNTVILKSQALKDIERLDRQISDSSSTTTTLISKLTARQDSMLREIDNLSSKYKHLQREFDTVISVKANTAAKSIQLAEKLLNTVQQAKEQQTPEVETAANEKQPETSPQEKVHLTEQQIVALNKDIRDCGVSVRLFNVLKAMDMDRLGDILRMSRAEIFKTRNFGRKTLAELDSLLERNNLYFGIDLFGTEFEVKS